MNIQEPHPPSRQDRRHRASHRFLLTTTLLAALLAATASHAALTLDAVIHHDPALPGEALQLDLTVANTDGVTRTGVVLEMVFPAGLDQLFETTFLGDCPSTSCSTGETVTWTLGSLPPGGHVTVEVPAVISNGAAPGLLIVFSPTVNDDSVDADSDLASVTVDAGPRFDLAMGEDSDPVAPGDLMTWKISWGFRSDAAVVTEAELTFPLPPGTTFVSASDAGNSDGLTVTWPLGFVAPGESGIREVTVEVDGGLVEGAFLEAVAQLINVDTPSEMATARTGTVIASSNGLSLVIESNTNPGRQDEYVNLNAFVTNNDPFTHFGVTLTARHPQDMAQLFESFFAGDCPSTACEANEQIRWSLGDLPAGGSVSVDLPGRITAAALDGVLVNLFMGLTDVSGVQVRQSDTIRVQGDTLYDVSLSEDADPVAAGEELTYRVHFGHRGDASTVSDSTLLFRLPDGASFVSATDSGAESAGVVSWMLGNLAPGEGGFRDVTVELDGTLPSSSTLETWAELRSLDTPVERTRAEAVTSIAPSSPLALTFESNTQPARVHERTRVQMTVTNNDPFTRFGVELASRMPQDTIQLFETAFGGDCASTACEVNELVTWELGDIPAGDSRSVDFPVDIAPAGIDGVLVNFHAAASDDQGVQTRANDALRVQSDTLYDVSLAESSDPAAAGATLGYQVTFGYRQDAASVSNSRLRLALPAGVAFVSASGGGSVAGNEVQWSLGSLLPGDGGQHSVEVIIDGGLAAATVLEAEVIIESIDTPLEHARAQAATVIAGSQPLSLAIEANPKPARAGETTNVQIIITNNDPFTRFGVVLTGQFPEDVQQLFELHFDGDCGSTACESGELVSWDVGDIAAGGSATVQLPVTLSNSGVDGLLVNFYLQAADDQGNEVRHVDTIRFGSDDPFELGLEEDADPAIPGDTVNYRLTFGYRADAAQVGDSTLTLELPDGMSVVSAGGGGIIDGTEITWSPGPFEPGITGVRDVTATVDAGVAAGTILEARAHIHSLADPLTGARAEAVTTVADAQPLSLSIRSTPGRAQASDQLLLKLSVTNNDPFPHFGVTLVNRFPQGVDQLFETAFDGDCPSIACEVGELVTWLLGEVGAGQTVTVDLPPTVSAGILDGELIDFYATVTDDTDVQASAVHYVRIGEPEVGGIFKDSFEGGN